MTARSKLCALAVASLLSASAACAAAAEPKQEVSYRATELALRGTYRFIVEQAFYKSPGDAEALAMEQILVVLKDGVEIDRREGWRWEVDDTPELKEGGSVSSKLGTDITGDGIPDIVLVEYSGGAHCCFTYYVFELRDPMAVQELYAGDYGAAFKQLDGHGALEVEISDTIFTYWRSPFAGSAAPDVILRYRNGAYEPAPDLMRAPAPSQGEIAQWVKESNEAEGWDMETKPRGSIDARDVSGAFLERVTQLIYEGHANLVPGFVDLAWPPAKPGKEAFVQELLECRVRRSEYWPAVAALNGLPAEKPIGKCD